MFGEAYIDPNVNFQPGLPIGTMPQLGINDGIDDEGWVNLNQYARGLVARDNPFESMYRQPEEITTSESTETDEQQEDEDEDEDQAGH